jgi:phage terminase Nu1 subunit (DNA packaging protein)
VSARDALPREPYIDARQLADVMGVSTRTVKRWVAAGCPSETWGMKRTRRFLASEVIGWARARDEGIVGPTTPRPGG